MGKNTKLKKIASSTEYVAQFTHFTRIITHITEVIMKHIVAIVIAFAVAAGAFAPKPIRASAGLPQANQPQTATLRGAVWADANHDGIRQDTEHGTSGITVTLYVGRVQVVTTTLTSATGEYEFTNLQPLSYTAGFGLPRDYSFTLLSSLPASASSTDSNVHANGLTDELSLNAGDEKINVDAGIWRSALVSDDPPTVQMHFVFIPFVSAGR